MNAVGISSPMGYISIRDSSPVKKSPVTEISGAAKTRPPTVPTTSFATAKTAATPPEAVTKLRNLSKMLIHKSPVSSRKPCFFMSTLLMEVDPEQELFWDLTQSRKEETQRKQKNDDNTIRHSVISI